jgi:hypothetical protein
MPERLDSAFGRRARTIGFRVCGFREPTTGHTAPGVITLTPDIERM